MKALIIAGLLISSLASAGVLTLTPANSTFEGIPLSSAGVLKIDGRAISVTQVASGLRWKKIVLIKPRVYVAQLFVSDPSKYVYSETGALNSLNDENAVVMTLHFLRNVNAEKVQNSFREALEENGVKLDDSSLVQVLDAVKKGGDAQENGTMIIAGERVGDKEILLYEDTQGKNSAMTAPHGLVQKLFSMWLGKPADSGLESLKKALTTKR